MKRLQRLAKDQTSASFCASYEDGWVGGWEKVLARRWRKRAMPVARKAFNIIPNYRHQMAFARSGALRSGEQRFATAVRIILIMLLAAERRW